MLTIKILHFEEIYVTKKSHMRFMVFNMFYKCVENILLFK